MVRTSQRSVMIQETTAINGKCYVISYDFIYRFFVFFFIAGLRDMKVIVQNNIIDQLAFKRLQICSLYC